MARTAAQRTTAKRSTAKRSTAKRSTAKRSTVSRRGTETSLDCPVANCDFVAQTPQGLGAHKSKKHGIKGNSASAQAKRRSGVSGNERRMNSTTRKAGSRTATTKSTTLVSTRLAPANGFDRDGLLDIVFPAGAVPVARLDELADWIAQGQQLYASGVVVKGG